MIPRPPRERNSCGSPLQRHWQESKNRPTPMGIFCGLNAGIEAVSDRFNSGTAHPTHQALVASCKGRRVKSERVRRRSLDVSSVGTGLPE
jgi:hypothetical protein